MMIIFSFIVDKNLNIYVIYSFPLHLWFWTHIRPKYDNGTEITNGYRGIV